MAAPFSLADFTYAHRGLWSADGARENSIAACDAAADAGIAIEFDVRLSKDGVPVCFHDRTLEKMTGRPGDLADFTAAELATFKLANTQETIPTLEAVLAPVASPYAADCGNKGDGYSARPGGASNRKTG